MKAFAEQITSREAESTPAGKAAQLLAGLAGLVAVPVVAWSEYALQTTGSRFRLMSCALLRMPSQPPLPPDPRRLPWQPTGRQDTRLVC